ncbi:DNA repair protein XRCC3 homolog isoform X2 [Coccinella septempunctata]|uniref:DNA repair protein XRCC3 homolog isoform X2 n=1 Tax=Coccinella septempunctata TaxID=41139 RepID=UPI001D06891E|nr:DNA repair protein XRCC3 homolog isoform X2 [Coccinella septempunctata]
MKVKIFSFSADLLCEYDRLKTGCSEIDKILRGGFRNNILNELVGTAGSGKTQICLYLSLMVQLPKQFGGLNKAAVYICTEDVFPIKRLYQMSSYFEQKFGIENSLDNVFISHIADSRLKKVLCFDIKHLGRFKSIGLIVIDSIGGLFRNHSSGMRYDHRSKDLAKIAEELRKLSSRFKCIILCCNQMTDNIKTGCSEPCLGLSWSNLVNSRFRITRTTSSWRTFEIIFSPDLPPAHCNFSIANTGIK